MDCRQHASGARFKVRVTPRSSRNECGGLHGDALKIKLNAPPVDGKANQALIGFLAELLQVKPGRLEVAAGLTSRTKTIQVSGLSPDEVLQRLGLA